VKLNHDPCPLIFSEGDEATKLAFVAFFGLGRSLPAKAWLLRLIKQQRSDGGFPSQLEPECWGMRETVRTALLLLGVGLPPEGINVDGAVRFVLRQQNQDGSWCENPALELPPEQTWLSGHQGITWLTADVVDLLQQAGLGGSGACRRALSWLRDVQTERGGWPSVARDVGDGEEVSEDPDATAQITFLLGEVFGADDPAYGRGRELFERNLDHGARDAERGYRIRPRDGRRADLDVYQLTHLLLSWLLDPPRRFRAGYDVSDLRVRRMMEALLDIQREDGGWRPFFAEESSPRYTVLAVKTLVLSGMIERLATDTVLRDIGPPQGD
jgi:hypothetical protein